MFKVFFLLLSLFDGCIIGAFVAAIIQRMFGKDNPLGKVLNVLLGIAAGGAYSMFCLWLLGSEVEIITGLIFLFAPPLLLLVLNAFIKK